MTKAKNEISLPLEGVDSEQCALIVDKGIAQIKGISSHRVELNNKRAIIQTTSHETVSEAVRTIRDLGYDVTTIKKSFPVLQMTCASCAVSVENMLKAQQGVVDASVNFANSMVSIEYIPGIVQAESLRIAVLSIGYDILIDENGSNDETVENIQKKKFNKLPSEFRPDCMVN